MYIVLYIVAINLISLLMMYIDKQKAIKGNWRIKEATFVILTLIGGGIGVQIGIYVFRHKTQKIKFTVLMPTIIIAQIALICYLLI